MQLHLFPPAPHPPILFSFTLPVLPSTLPFPQAYATQLQLLLFTEIEPPPSPYALDKAVWAVHLIEIVVFDMANRRVEVKMVDGAYMEWEMRGEEVLLNRVMDDVEASKNEAEREMRKKQRREQEEIAAAAAAAAYLPMTHPGPMSDMGHYEAKGSGGSKPMHRRSKSLFSSLLSALNLNAGTGASPSSSSSAEYRIGGRAQKDAYEPRSSTTADDGEQFCYPTYAITALSTSEYTYPMRAQLARNGFSASKVLRRRARGTLVDCFRRWIIPAIRERFQWGAFPPLDDMPDLDGNSNVEGDGVKWGKISKATNAYADWACRSMISRCERALRTANALVEGVESLAQTPSSEGGEVAEKESRRSSASSMLASAISASSRASSSAEQVYSGHDTEIDNGSPISLVQQNLQAPTPTTASTKASRRTSAAVRHAATLRTALDHFREIHDSLALEAIDLADSHTMAMRVLEARGRRKAWSSSEGGGLCRPSPLGAPPITSGCTSSSSQPHVNKLNTTRAEQGYGSGNSLWELSIPLVRSTLGEISDTWEDLQMEWEMEKEFGSEVEFEDEDDEEFPAIISDFDISGDSISTGYKSKVGRRSDASTSYNEDPTECGHSGFSDSSSSEDEMGCSDSDDISDRTPSPTSPSDLQACSSVDGKVGKAKRGRRTGVKARMGKYEDVRNELPPDPPLMALSPPPRGKFAVSRRASSGDAGIGSSPAYNEHDKTTGRPPRPARPSRLQVPLNDAVVSHHRREAASGTYPDFGQSRVDDSEAGVFDEWDTVDDDDGVFGCPSSSHPGATNHHIAKVPLNNSAEPCKPLKAFQIFDGLGVGILEQVGGATEATRKPLGHGYSIQNGVGIGIGYPPGLHGDLPSPPSSPTKRTITPPESPRRVSHYISRELPPPTSNYVSAAAVPHAPPLVMEKETKRVGRPRPRLTLTFPDPPSYNPAELPTGRGSSLPYTRPFESIDNLLGGGGGSHVGGGSADQGAIVSPTEEGGRTCLSKVENDSPVLLLDTPTAEHPSTSSSYPYTWDVDVLPPGVKVIGTVGVSPASASASKSSSSEMVVVERSVSPDIPAGCIASSSSSSSGTSPFTAVAKVLSKVRKVKPVLYVTPPPPPSAEDITQELAQQPIRLVKLNRSKSWKELSVAGGINFRAEIMKRRRSADSVPTASHSHSEVDTPPASLPSQSQQEEEEGDRTVVLDDSPSLSPESVEADYSVFPMSALSRTRSELESGWATPSLVPSSSPSSATSSGFSSLNSTALDITGDLSSSSSDSSGNYSEAYDGIFMTPHAHTHYQSGSSEPTVVLASGEEKYAIQEGWFPNSAPEEEEEDEAAVVVVDEPATSLDSPAPTPVEIAATASTCPVTGSGFVSKGPRKLKRAQSATRPGRTGTERPPPPPRPVKSIKRSLSLSTFGRKFEAPVPVLPANE